METETKYKFLDSINYPADLKKLKLSDLKKVTEELRDYMIDTISKIGGHLGASLGVAELTVALHYVFDTPTDKLIWDVGHQAYAHKIITGRRDVFHTNRMYGGLSGFPKRKESEYDAFGVGPSKHHLQLQQPIAAPFSLAVPQPQPSLKQPK